MALNSHRSAWLSICVFCFAVSNVGATDEVTIRSLLTVQCFECHGNGQAEGNLQLDQLLDLRHSAETKQIWWKVLQNVRAGTMPPPDSGQRLTLAESQSLSNWIKYEAFEIDAGNPDPGRVTIRRLNRREYGATVQDLMGIQFNADIVFPPDDTGYGFDNIGDALSLSTLLMEKYLSSAAQIVEEAVPHVTSVIPIQSLSGRDFTGEDGADADDMKTGEPVTASAEFEVLHAGEYVVDLLIRSHGSFEFNPQRCRLSFELDGKSLHEGEYGWDESKKHPYAFNVVLEPGKHRFVVQLLPIELDADIEIPAGSTAEVDVQSVLVKGPADRRYWKHPQRYELFFTRDSIPETREGKLDYAREVMSRFCSRAYRRPVDEETLKQLVSIVAVNLDDPQKTFEEACAGAMIPVLASPRFLFRMEAPEPADAGQKFPRIDEYSLASRLSYLLWSTMPDDELFDLAAQGSLRTNLESQVSRMLADQRSDRFVKNFIGQWLRTNDIEKVSINAIAALGFGEEWEHVTEEFSKLRRQGFSFRRQTGNRDPEVEKLMTRFRELRELQDLFDADVRKAMRRETEMLVEYILREDRSLTEIVNPTYSFLNAKLAKLYGIDGVEGDHMRRVELPADSPRGGILSQGTMLAVTSNPTRTSPVKRGLFILENILGTPTPPAPPNVPELDAAKERFAGREPSLKELLEVHRESALCASCHSRMDPLGLALENFNAIGGWREAEFGETIDASGQLITGEKFDGVQQLKQLLVNERRKDFYRCFTQKLLVYALGRGLEYYDEHTVDSVVQELDQQDGHFSVALSKIVQSAAFQRSRFEQADEQLTSK
ncbi:MAG: DUF1592 domain-containing protein [Planctomycetales bacterium]|nr:DUF1592 domain-containing protein [Planctomycetales bacterium]